MAAGHGGGGSKRSQNAKSVAGSQRLTPPRGAARPPSLQPHPLLGRGGESRNLPLRESCDRTLLRCTEIAGG